MHSREMQSIASEMQSREDEMQSREDEMHYREMGLDAPLREGMEAAGGAGGGGGGRGASDPHTGEAWGRGGGRPGHRSPCPGGGASNNRRCVVDMVVGKCSISAI